MKGSKVVGEALFEGVGKPLIRLAADSAPGTAGPAGVPIATKRSKEAKETDLEALLGKSIVNFGLHGDRPEGWKEAAGLGLGVAGVLPLGRLGKTAAAIGKATSAAKRESLTVKAAERIAAKHTPDEIAAQRKIIAEKLVDGDSPTLAAQDKILKRAEDLLPKPVHGPPTEDEFVQSFVREAVPARETQEAGYTVERGIRIKAADEAFVKAGGGQDGLKAALTELKGELPKINVDGFTELTPEAVNHMINRVADSGLGRWEQVRAQVSLVKATQGRTPTRSEIELLRRVFGDETADLLADPANITFMSLFKHYGLDVWNFPRSILASFDLSAPFRQSLVAGAAHPILFARNFKPMLRSYPKDEWATEIMDDIAGRENLPRYLKAKLALTETGGADIALREEAFPSPLADKVPGVRASGRAYTIFLNKMRADMFDHLIEVAEAAGKDADDPKFLKSLGAYINSATGRGGLPGGKSVENAANFLNSFLFSPRLLASRFNMLNPVWYAKQDPFVRRQALKAARNLIGGISAFLYLGSQITGASVGLDPRSANFAKLRIGDTRIDVAGGFLPLLNLYSRLATGETISSATGEKKKLTGEFGESSEADVLQRFVETKLAPSPSMVWEILKQRDFTGQPLTLKDSLQSMLVPLNIQGGLSTYQTEDSVPAGVGAGLLGSVGFGVNSYPDRAAGGPARGGKSSWKMPPKPSGGSVSGSSSGSSDKSSWSIPPKP